MIEILVRSVAIIFIYLRSDVWIAAKTIALKIFKSAARETMN